MSLLKYVHSSNTNQIAQLVLSPSSQGGLKAVMWTDSFQMFIIMGGFLAVVIQGTIEVGGFYTVWDTAREGGKLEVFK